MDAARPRDLVVGALFVAYLAVVAWGTLGPSPGEEIDRAARRAKAAERVVVGDRGPSSADMDRPRFAGLTGEEVGNVAMFVPFGVLAPVAFRRWRWWTVPAGVALSGLIELTQLAVLSHRSPQWADVGWNGLGTVIGFSLWLGGSWVWWRSRSGGGRRGTSQ